MSGRRNLEGLRSHFTSLIIISVENTRALEYVSDRSGYDRPYLRGKGVATLKKMPVTKRLLISLTGGILLPFGYFLLIVPFIELTKSLTIGRVLLIPLVWSSFLYLLLFGSEGSQTTYVLFTVVCDVILYGLITYAVLFALQREKPQPKLPPPPPQF